ncbi:MAG: flagellar protein FlaG [Candidatus Thiodiazotropha sp. (ex Lucina pensylvanica)]|nr:flagellar protein FlaG [Candidatus Thiodiazotropha sp. (ex Lucina pensylvanica)]
MPNVINNFANEYAYKRDVSKTAQSPAAQNLTPSDEGEKKQAADVEQPLVIDSKALALNVENLTQIVNRNLEFSIDQETGTQVIRVIDSDTGELVRQIPPDQILHVISHIEEMQDELLPGVLLDDRV